MLYSVVIGNSDKVNKWTLGTDDYGNSFIGNDEIHQRVRYGKNVPTVFNAIKESSTISIYELPEKIFFSNNNKNMNLNIVNFWSKDKNTVQSHEDDDILYVTMTCDMYKLLKYDLNEKCEIVQTFHMKNTYVGCAIKFHPDLHGEHLITISTRETKEKGRYIEIKLAVTGDNVVVEYNNVLPKESLVKLSTLSKKYMNFSVGFRMKVNGRFLTKTYIASESATDELIKLTAGIKDCNIITIGGDAEITSLKELDEEAMNYFTKEIKNENVRAITLCGVKLPKEFCKEFRILYMFDYDIENDKLTCIRSN